MSIADHIESGLNISYSFKTEKYYLVDGDTVIKDYTEIEDAVEDLKIVIRSYAYGDHPEKIHEYIRKES